MQIHMFCLYGKADRAYSECHNLLAPGHVSTASSLAKFSLLCKPDCHREIGVHAHEQLTVIACCEAGNTNGQHTKGTRFL